MSARLRPAARVRADAAGFDLARVRRRGEPVVLAGLASSWPAVGTWTPAFFARQIGDHQVRLHAFSKRDAVPCTIAEFVRWLDGHAPPALAGHSDLYLAWDDTVLGQHSELAAAFDLRSLFGRRPALVRTGFWMGGTGAHTALHFDVDADNLHAVVCGRKRFVLFGPDQSDRLYPADVYEWTTVFSSVDLRQPDLARYPRFAEAAGLEAELGPGDVLLLPAGWWHAATCLEPTISINGWHIGPRLLASPAFYRHLVRRTLHAAGLYARGRCTCCGHGDLRRHLGWDSAPAPGHGAADAGGPIRASSAPQRRR